MGIGRGIKNFAKDQVNAPKWVGLDFLSDTITGLVNTTRSLVIPRKATYQESFEEAVARLNLTEEDIANRLKHFQRAQWLFIVLATLVLIYFFDLLFEGSMTGCIICLAVLAITASQFFHYSFWAFQIKKRKLGCTFQEWWEAIIKRSTS